MKDHLGYKGKVCVVVGVGPGTGRYVTESLVDAGAEVYCLDMNEVDHTRH